MIHWCSDWLVLLVIASLCRISTSQLRAKILKKTTVSDQIITSATALKSQSLLEQWMLLLQRYRRLPDCRMYAKAADTMAWHCSLLKIFKYWGASISAISDPVHPASTPAKSFGQSLVTLSWYYCIERIQRKKWYSSSTVWLHSQTFASASPMGCWWDLRVESFTRSLM